jgi:general nucleoside transport system ATP-binding protein
VIAHSQTARDALSLIGITRRFGATVALDDVSVSVQRGTVHALLGENGAGKTTLMSIAFGLVRPDAGRVEIDGERRQLRSASDAIAAGIGMVHQHFTSVPAMTVAENVALGGNGLFRAAVARRTVEDIGATTGLLLDPTAYAGDLPVGAQQRLEIVKALARGARTLILDEPTAVLTPSETDDLLRWLREFASADNSVILVTHKLREALAVADDVTVLRRGRIALTGSATTATADGLAAAMLGRPIVASNAVAPPRGAGAAVAVARHIRLCDRRGAAVIRDASFDVRAGEILGIAAIEGAGQRELLRALASRARVASGELRLPHAIGFVPEDRHRDALVLDFSASENVALRAAGARRGPLAWKDIRLHTLQLIRDFDVRGTREGVPVRFLSGGNQQKLVLARELDGAPPLLVVENPTRGLDIGATQQIHERLRSASVAGAAIVMYSSDLDEVLALASRVIVIHNGEVRETAPDRQTVGRAMLGVA